MTRRRRKGSSSSSEKSHSSEIRRSTAPSTFHRHSSRYHSTETGRSTTPSTCHRHSSRHHSAHSSSHYENKFTFCGKLVKQTLSEEIASVDVLSIIARLFEFDSETDRKLSTSNTQKEGFKNVDGNHSGRLQNPFDECLRDHDSKEKVKIEKEKPNFEPSGKLAEDTNTYRGVVIKYNEPSDAHMPKLRWRLYPFKGDEALPVLYIHRQSAYLIGRDRKIADLPVDHPSCSKQHAVFQYRLTPKDLPDGTTVKRIRPYIIDLNSANGTYLNNERIESQRFVELREKDVLKFGFSSREFVLLNEKSNDEDVEMVKKEELSPS
ncbi:unnamed protein product [Onchocerca ochengi]|uniref:FHA domain-containing protein n=1 Tax=Onchocerca ochengi TaxID=42157 RepID=A0A182EGY2_ONCOC|nr:unnamed protein product [Onchocerca ochengi]